MHLEQLLSTGGRCVIAQLFLDGEPLFDLAGLMSYRKVLRRE